MIEEKLFNVAINNGQGELAGPGKDSGHHGPNPDHPPEHHAPHPEKPPEPHGPHPEHRPEHQRTFAIFVNGRRFVWEKSMISFEEVITLAFGSYNPAPNIAYTVSYFNGPKDFREGTLTKGHSIPVKDGEKINADRTDRS